MASAALARPKQQLTAYACTRKIHTENERLPNKLHVIKLFGLDLIRLYIFQVLSENDFALRLVMDSGNITFTACILLDYPIFKLYIWLQNIKANCSALYFPFSNWFLLVVSRKCVFLCYAYLLLFKLCSQRTCRRSMFWRCIFTPFTSTQIHAHSGRKCRVPDIGGTHIERSPPMQFVQNRCKYACNPCSRTLLALECVNQFTRPFKRSASAHSAHTSMRGPRSQHEH